MKTLTDETFNEAMDDVKNETNWVTIVNNYANASVLADKSVEPDRTKYHRIARVARKVLDGRFASLESSLVKANARIQELENK